MSNQNQVLYRTKIHNFKYEAFHGRKMQGWDFIHRVFEQIARFLWAKEQKSDSLVKKSKLLLSLFCHERPEQIAHSRSFVKRDGSKSLMVALSFGATWAICSRSLFEKERLSKEQQEQRALWQKRGENYKNIWKIRLFRIFPSELLIFKRFAQVALSMSNLSKLLMHCDKSLDDFRAIDQSAAGIKFYITEVF